MAFPPPAFSRDSREKNIQQLRTGDLDVLILGGGINGAGIARDLALRARKGGRPLRIALVEQHQFASGTSGKNSQLIHGGLRYLKYFEFGLVRQALRERATLLQLAPHLVEPLSFLIPMYGRFEQALYGTGLWLYDILAGSRKVGRRRSFTAAEVARVEPGLSLDGLVSAAMFYDCRVHSARFVLENIFDAGREGVLVVNYARAEAAPPAAVTIIDDLNGGSFQVRARKIVDTTGPWSTSGSLRLVRGSHIVLPRLNASASAIAYFDDSGRIVFVIPWGSASQLSLVGTTDEEHSSGPDDVRITPGEVEYLCGIVRKLFPGAAGLGPISAYSSLRPLLADSSGSATEASREHRIWNTSDGVLHVAGGKYTTYRAMSQEACDEIATELAPELAGRCSTAEEPLGGNHQADIARLRDRGEELAAGYGVTSSEMFSAIHDFGVQATSVLEYLPRVAPPGLTRVQAARIRFAVEHEMARRLPDILFVSSYWGYERRWTCADLDPLAAEMGRLLGWDEHRKSSEIDLALRIMELP